MTLIRQASAAAILVTLTLCLQSAGIAALISWARSRLRRNDRFDPSHSAMLMVRFTTAIIALHLLQVLLWAAFYRWLCFPAWESAFYFSFSRFKIADLASFISALEAERTIA